MQRQSVRLSLLSAFVATLATALLFAGAAAAREHRTTPPIRNWNSLRITLDRGLCFGRCPAYRVSIHGDGRVVYDGRKYVRVTGRRVYRIPRARARQLFREFFAADFFALKNYYSGHVTDRPTYRLSITYDGHKKTITDNSGTRRGMPKTITRLERLVDAIARTDRLTGRKPHHRPRR